MDMKTLYEELSRLEMSIYTPFDYLLPNRQLYYAELYDTKVSENVSLTQSNREKSIQKLMKVNLLKRLESSVDSFRITIGKFIDSVNNTIKSIEI
jgi:predicted transcriptional regulator